MNTLHSCPTAGAVTEDCRQSHKQRNSLKKNRYARHLIISSPETWTVEILNYSRHGVNDPFWQTAWQQAGPQNKKYKEAGRVYRRSNWCFGCRSLRNRSLTVNEPLILGLGTCPVPSVETLCQEFANLSTTKDHCEIKIAAVTLAKRFIQIS